MTEPIDQTNVSDTPDVAKDKVTKEEFKAAMFEAVGNALIDEVLAEAKKQFLSDLAKTGAQTPSDKAMQFVEIIMLTTIKCAWDVIPAVEMLSDIMGRSVTTPTVAKD